jgi:hypothetical protein
MEFGLVFLFFSFIQSSLVCTDIVLYVSTNVSTIYGPFQNKKKCEKSSAPTFGDLNPNLDAPREAHLSSESEPTNPSTEKGPPNEPYQTPLPQEEASLYGLAQALQHTSHVVAFCRVS